MQTFPLIAIPEYPVILIVAALLGLVCGSFVTALSHRLPRGEDFVSGRSRCPHCKTSLSARDLVPVLSWLMSRARCRHCQVAVSGRYPAIELLCSFLFAAVVLVASPFEPIRVALLCGLVVALLALSVIDLEFRRLPNGLVLFVFALCSVLTWLDQRAIVDVATGMVAVLVFGIFLRVLGQFVEKKPGLGWGDIKLATAISVALPLSTAPVFLTVGGVVALILAAWFGWRHRQRHIPLGPALCAGAFAAFL
ncbi:MAG: prepilin peptidase [Rhodospirillaceae bacterium]|nr:prepilin peptidase [Rhodospirillaceae bacterium]MBT5565714.1 prepilin peptidase [Rhodospirillaceae bacterium]MBT6090789.1 prepilin peptidase [Rhodospirillaceae bacterium]MBT7450877.1 prepilin peptidase [Rhodospirillaceae bacterium]